MTIIKQKAVSSERHGENVRRYLNGKDAVMREGWNIECEEHWYMRMATTREAYGHDHASRQGAKNTIMYHQILAFLPEECSINGGKMTPDRCMQFAVEYVARNYPNQQVVFALHEENDKQGKRYAVHMAINRTDLMTGLRLHEGTGKQGHHKRVVAVRKMDDEWGLQQVEEGKPNSLIRNRSPRDAEKAIIEDDRYSYKNNVRQMMKIVLKTPSVKTVDDLIKRMREYGIEMKVRKGKLLATDVDVRDMGNPKCTFDMSKMDGNFTLPYVRKALASKSTQSSNAQVDVKADYFARLDKALAAFREMAKDMGEGTPKMKLPKRPKELKGDHEVTEKRLAIDMRADKIREKAGAVKRGGTHVLPGRGNGTSGASQDRTLTEPIDQTRKDSRGGGARSTSR